MSTIESKIKLNSYIQACRHTMGDMYPPIFILSDEDRNVMFQQTALTKLLTPFKQNKCMCELQENEPELLDKNFV